MPNYCKPLALSIGTLLALTAAPAQDLPSPTPTSLQEVVVTANPLGRSAFDEAQPVSTLRGLPLKLKLGPTLGETLSGEPGVTASAYTAGASRPIIRGLADNRVLVLQNGTDIFDVSNLSPDHNPSLVPLAAQRVDVVRGAATILYGSSAIGGVVNVIDSRIPTEVPATFLSGEVDGRFSSASLERSTFGSLTLRATDHLVFHLDGTLLRTDNQRIPGHALSDREHEALSPEQEERGSRFGGDPEHLVPNTTVKTQDFGLGVSYIGERGYLGFSFSQFRSEYGVPDNPTVDDPVESPARVKLDLSKRQYNLRGSLTDPLPGFQGGNLKLTYTEYRHNELDDNLVGSTFRTHGLDSRLELLHNPIGKVEGSLGLQFLYRTLGVYGDEAFLRPNQTLEGAAFVFEELNLQPVRFQFGARVEYQRIHLGSDDPEFTALSRGGETTKEFVPISAAAGLIWDFAKDTNAALTARYSERSPTPEELYARGPHDATFQFLIGEPGLSKERVLGLDLSVKKKAGFVTGSVSAFYNHFFDFIDFAETGAAEDGLSVFQYADKKADFYGGEGELAFHFLPQSPTRPTGGHEGKSVKAIVTKETADGGMENPNDLYLVFTADYVHAQDETERRPLGRIPPLRYGAALGFQGPALGVRLELERVNHQDRTAAFESGTEGYTFLNASVNYTFTRGTMNYDFYLRGTNLTDETARDHTSFLKDVIPLAGRSVTAGVRVTF